MLNKYLHETHTVDEKIKSKSSTTSTHNVGVTVNEAGEKLDQEMKRRTDPRLLRKARHEQRGTSLCLLKNTNVDIDVELDYGRGSR